MLAHWYVICFMPKEIISTSKWCVRHLLAGHNKQYKWTTKLIFLVPVFSLLEEFD